MKTTPRITKKTVTVKELLLQIAAIIADEPKRIDMNWWVTRLSGQKPRTYSWEPKLEVANGKLPDCGTIACLAGWGATLLRPDDISARKLSNKAEQVMEKLIGYDDTDYGITTREVGGLFEQNRTDEEYNNNIDLGSPGTRKHARAITRRIKLYLKDHPEVANRVINVAEARKMFARRG